MPGSNAPLKKTSGFFADCGCEHGELQQRFPKGRLASHKTLKFQFKKSIWSMGFRTMAFLMSSDRPDLVFQDLCSFKVQAS